MRLTRDYLRSRIDYLQKIGFDVAINWLNGSARVTSKSESRDISPRLRNAEMNEWISGFFAGIEAGNERTQKKLQPLRERLEAWRDNAELMMHLDTTVEIERWKNERDNYSNLIEILDKL